MKAKEELKERKSIQKQATGILTKEVMESPATQNPLHAAKEKERVMKSHNDTLHNLIHGRCAQEVREQYGKSKHANALQLLREHEPIVAKKFETYNKLFVTLRDNGLLNKKMNEVTSLTELETLIFDAIANPLTKISIE